jgi:GT2 family glycosyltransferase
LFEDPSFAASVLNYKKVSEAIRLGRYTEALVYIQEQISAEVAVAPDELLLRMQILSKIGALDAARADLDVALSIDPLDAECLEAACGLWPERAETFALRLLQSPVSQKQARARLVQSMASMDGPIIAVAKLPTTVRVTLLSPPALKTTVQGLEDDDFHSVLSSKISQNGASLAVEYFFQRQENTERTVQFSVGTEWHQEVRIPCLTKKNIIPKKNNLSNRAAPWILIPVHNGGQVVVQCLESVAKAIELSPKARVVIIDDLTTDAETLAAIEQASAHSRITVLRNSRNLGFVGAVNAGLQSAGPGPVLLLNSDTYLPRQSLPRLIAHLNADEAGTVTPFSNNAGSFSLPVPRQPFQLPDSEESEALADTAYEVNQGLGVDVHNGNGFCMLISEDCRQALPQLSEDIEGGYYEEVEYSLRAAELGFRNLCATDCFVGHVGSQSFGDRKKLLAAENLKRVQRVFPEYVQVHGQFVRSNPLAEARDRVMAKSTWQPVENKDASLPDRNAIDLSELAPDVVVLPVRGSVSATALAPWFSKLILISQTALSASLLTLEPGHDHVLEGTAGADGRVRLRLLGLDNSLSFETELYLTATDSGKIAHFERRCFQWIKFGNA